MRRDAGRRRRSNGKLAELIETTEEWSPGSASSVRPVDGEDPRGDAGYFNLVHATVEQARLDVAHRCGYVACGSERTPARSARHRECPVRLRAEKFLRDLKAGRHFLSGWCTLAAMRSGLDTHHEPDVEMIPTLFRPRLVEPEPVDGLTEDDDAVLV